MPDFDENGLEETDDLDLGEDELAGEGQDKKINLIKVGLPVVAVQLILAFVAANYFIVPKFFSSPVATDSTLTAVEDTSGEAPSSKFGAIYNLEDVIVNPAQSDGQFILINLAIEVNSNQDIEILKKRDVQARDILIRLISGKTISELDGPEDKEKLRDEIKEQMGQIIPESHLRNIYFSNYLIQ